LVEGLPEPLERKSSHLQLFDNYIHETRLRLRSVRVPETKEWTLLLQKRYPAGEYGAEWRIEQIELTTSEYEHFKPFEGNEIRKNRYFEEFDGRRFEFDVYLGPLWGLNRTRVEFVSREEMESFTPPAFTIVEITDVPFFDDANLVNCKFEDVQAEVERILSKKANA
jgi:CYTH domain-containing protein